MALSFLPNPLRRNVQRLLELFLDQRPASRLIRQTAREQWKLISVNIISNLLMALTEGTTLAVIYLAVGLLNRPGAGGGILQNYLTATFGRIPTPILFVGLMMVALLLQIGQSLASYCSSVSIAYFSARCDTMVTSRIHSQILSFSFSCASRYRVGDLSNQLSDGPLAVILQANLTNQILVGILMVATYLAILLRISPWLVLVAFVIGALMVMIQKQLMPKIRQESWRANDSSVEVSSRIIEDIQGLRLLHTSGQLQQAGIRLQIPLQELERSKRSSARMIQVIEPFSRLMPVLAFVIIASISSLVFQDRSAGVLPNLVTFMLALQRLNARLSDLATSSNVLSENSGRLNRLNQILDPSDKQFRRQGGKPFSKLCKEVRFDQVGLRYSPDLPPALENISFSIPKGSTVALVGSSGAGKSSIADLLVGLYNPSSGRILVDGIDLATIDLTSWQQHLGVVSQDTFLFNASLAENIAFGCPWATSADIENAARLAQAAGFIATLPEGYETAVGERGYRLSGGQRQRISLARALLRRPELLILDEATSALDSESERLVQQAIEAFGEGQTILVIAHRLSTIKNSNTIMVIEKGLILEAGSHRQLLAANGRYAHLWQQQSSGSLSKPIPVG